MINMLTLDEAMNMLLSPNDVNIIDQRISELRTRRNNLLPISRLPAEIMTDIFLLLARPPQILIKDCWDWLELTKVCKSWRELALGCTTLWAEINSTFTTKKVKVFLERSGRVDLIIDLQGYNGRGLTSSGILELISPHMNRVRDIRIGTGKDIAEWSTIQSLFEYPLQRLKCLNFNAHNWGRSDDQQPSSVQLDKLAKYVPVVPFDEVSLASVILPWNSPIFYRVSVLSLEHIQEVINRPTVDELLGILAACPGLRYLNLSKAGPRFSLTNHRGVALPRLKKVDISEIEYKVLVELFSSLVVPKDVGWLIDDVLSPFDVSKSFPINLLDRSSVCNRLYLNLDNESLSLTPKFGRGTPHPKMSLNMNCEHVSTLQHGFVSFFESLGTLLKHSFFDNITSVSFQMTYLRNSGDISSFNTTAWEHFLTVLPKLENLQVDFPSERNTGLDIHFIAALAETWSDFANKAVCPSLKKLDLFCATFSTVLGRQAYEKLLANLQFRKRGGKHLKLLKLNNCGIGSEELQRMKDLNIAEDIVV